jgi:hypothetical protein
MKLVLHKRNYALVGLVYLFVLAGCASEEIRTQRKLYDEAFSNSILYNTEMLLELQGKKYRAGEIVLKFHLTYDGQVTNMKVIKDNGGDGLALVCQKAVFMLAPYPRWPEEQIHETNANYRVVTYKFKYD